MTVLRDLRMRQAAEQLRTGQVPIEQVVRNTGYESRSSFARAFRKAFGMDPSEYRAESDAESTHRESGATSSVHADAAAASDAMS